MKQEIRALGLCRSVLIYNHMVVGYRIRPRPARAGPHKSRYAASG
jgi:hypothetical protein